jgi:heme oxygenase
MNLKEATAEKHAQAEKTPFMRAVFQQKLPIDLWCDYTYQRQLIYNAIEGVAGACGLLKDLPDIQRAHYLYRDYMSMVDKNLSHKFRKPTVEYHNYILNIYPDNDRIMAHLYVWHMGDLYGGQMIKKIIPGSHLSLTFKDPELLKTNIRNKLKDTMADEANIAFDWAIKLLNDYDVSNLE